MERPEVIPITTNFCFNTHCPYCVRAYNCTPRWPALMTSGRNARSRNCRAEARRYRCDSYGRSSGSASRVGMPKLEPLKPLTKGLRVYTLRASLQAVSRILGDIVVPTTRCMDRRFFEPPDGKLVVGDR